MFHRWHVRHCQKGGRGVGKTKRGKGTKLMAVADGAGLPLAISIESASPHEVRLVEGTLEKRFVEEAPQRLIGDRAYDSDPLDERLREQGIELIAPHKSNRSKPATQDGRVLRRYRRRWKVERLFAWLQNFRRIQTRHDRILENYLAFVLLGCMLILLRSRF
jgi:transposase